MRSWRNSGAGDCESVHPEPTPGEYAAGAPISDDTACPPYSLLLLCLYVSLVVAFLLLVSFGLTCFSVWGIKRLGWRFIYGGLSVLFALATAAEISNGMHDAKAQTRSKIRGAN